MHHSYLHHSYMHQDQGSCICASWVHANMHQSQGSRIIYVSIIIRSRIIDICIVLTCIIHTYIRVKDQIYMHHTHTQQDQFVIDVCVIHICIKIKGHRYKNHPTPRIALSVRPIQNFSRITDICIMDTCMYKDQRSGSEICASYLCIIQGSYIHASYIHAYITDICIIDACMYQDQGLES